MKTMKVHEIRNLINFYQEGMRTSANALALAMSYGSEQYIIDGLLKDYEKYSKKYYDFMDSEVTVEE